MFAHVSLVSFVVKDSLKTRYFQLGVSKTHNV
jgi:hypothetical protein